MKLLRIVSLANLSISFFLFMFASFGFSEGYRKIPVYPPRYYEQHPIKVRTPTTNVAHVLNIIIS